MARRTVEVLPFESGMARDLTGLWLASRIDAGTSQEVASRAASEGRLTHAIERGDLGAFLARIDGEPVGFVITSANPFGLAVESELAIEQLWVSSAFRRHGVARALLSAVCGYAERSGSEVIVSNVPVQARDANRFFARLGFGSVLVRRVTTTANLRRKLDPAKAEGALEILRRRRVLRAGAPRQFVASEASSANSAAQALAARRRAATHAQHA